MPSPKIKPPSESEPSTKNKPNSSQPKLSSNDVSTQLSKPINQELKTSKSNYRLNRILSISLLFLIISAIVGWTQRSNIITDEKFLELLADLPALSESYADVTDFLTSKSFLVGRAVASSGPSRTKSTPNRDAVILIPGIISSGLESWSTTEENQSFFKTRIWGGTSMLQFLIRDQRAWIDAMILDSITGLDPVGNKLRAVDGLLGASNFMPGFWLWEKIIQHLAVLEYDNQDLFMSTYDWRLSLSNLEVRDSYFSILRNRIEFSKKVHGKKTTLVSHSYGSTVVLYFFNWVELETGDPNWVEEHISNFVNIAGTLLGVVKAQAAMISGEFKDTVNLPGPLVWAIEKLFSKLDRSKLFQSWGGASGMLLKGGDSVWGGDGHAPDDYSTSFSAGDGHAPDDDCTSTSFSHLLKLGSRNLTVEESLDFLWQETPSSYRRMVESNYSLGMERDPVILASNKLDHRTWSNPLESSLPFAPSLTIYSIYGVGKETERGYHYHYSGEINSTRAEIDGSQNSKNTRNGVIFGEGDGTVNLLSLGAMSVAGWKLPRYNPAGVKIITHELLHLPVSFDPRGGGSTSDHVDILGNNKLIEAILKIASSDGDQIKDQFHSNIRDYASRIKWH